MRRDSLDIMRQVKEMYDESGVYFSKTRNKTYQGKSKNWPVTQKYLDKLGDGARVLDVGCGNGRLVSGLPKGVSYLGFDFSKTLIDEAKKSYPQYEFVEGELTSASTWAKLGRYDAIFCVAVLHHIPEKNQQIQALKEMYKHAKRGATLFVSVWNLWQDKILQIHLDHLDGEPQRVEVPFDGKWKRFCVKMDIPYLVEIVQNSGWELSEVFCADKNGERADIVNGQNLVVIAKK